MKELLIKTLEETKSNILMDIEKAVEERRPEFEIDTLLDNFNEVVKLIEKIKK